MKPCSARRRILASNVPKSYALRFLLGCFGLSIPTIVLLWEANGVPIQDGMLLQAVFALMLALLDVPTGYLADAFGRKPAIIGAAFCILGGAVIYSVATNFVGFLAGEVLLALGFSLSSGADQALLYDSLIELGRKDEYERIWSKGTALGLAAASVFATLGGFAAMYSLRLPCYLEVGFSVVLVGVALSVAEPQREEAGDKGRLSVKEIVRVSMQSSARVRWLILYPAVLFAFSQSYFWLYQPYFRLSGLPFGLFGVAYALFNLAAAAAAHQAPRFSRMSERGRMIALAVVLGMSFLLLGSIVGKLSFLFILLMQLVRGYQQVVFSELLNREIASGIRASILSVQSMGHRVLYALLLLPVSALVGHAGTCGAFLVGGAVTLLTGYALVASLYVPEVEQ